MSRPIEDNCAFAEEHPETCMCVVEDPELEELVWVPCPDGLCERGDHRHV